MAKTQPEKLPASAPLLSLLAARSTINAMNFPKVLSLLLAEFAKRNIDFALIGGLAIHGLGISRTTRDVDGLVLLSKAEEIDQLMRGLGYEAVQRTNDIGTYVSKNWELGRVDFLFAHHRYATEMLQRAKPQRLFDGFVKIVLPEDLIGLKVQSSSNDPARNHQDMSDIESLLKRHGRQLDWARIEDYFKIFHREMEYRDLARRFKDAER